MHTSLNDQWCKLWGGQGGTVPSKVLTEGTAVLTPPPKLKLRRNTARSCFVRSHKEYVTYYNFESAIVKLQFSLCILSSGGSREIRAPSLNLLKKLKKCNLKKNSLHTHMHHVRMYDTCIRTQIHVCIIHTYTEVYIHWCIHTYMHEWIVEYIHTNNPHPIIP